ncbi:MAG TPA: hypothetical protein VFW98_17885 [Gemmatimonadaceae bacterium]|nr:hypothetical protein [Gemmatimonadaceae bacterium]
MRTVIPGAVLAAAFIGVAAMAPSRAQAQADTSLHISQYMTGAELDSTGLSTLNPAQRAALDAWFANFAATAAQTVQRTQAPPQELVIRHASVRNGFRVSQVRDNGSSVALEDGTVWKIAPDDRATTDTWHTGDFVLVRRSPVTVDLGGEQFAFTLVNGRNIQSKTAARLIGRLPGGAP